MTRRAVDPSGRMRANGRVSWTEVGTVESDSEKGVFHTIKARTADGHFGCSCLSYRFRRGDKWCKHTIAWRGSLGSIGGSSLMPIEVSGERFMVRRRAVDLTL